MKIFNRVFYINVDGLHPQDVAQYIDSVKSVLKNDDTSTGIDKLRESKQWEDLFIPVRNSPTKIEIFESDTEKSLPNFDAEKDMPYIHSKKIPNGFFGIWPNSEDGINHVLLFLSTGYIKKMLSEEEYENFRTKLNFPKTEKPTHKMGVKIENE